MGRPNCLVRLLVVQDLCCGPSFRAEMGRVFVGTERTRSGFSAATQIINWRSSVNLLDRARILSDL